MPRPFVLLRTIVAPAPSPNKTAVVRSVQSMMLVSFSEAITSTCSACSAAMIPSAVLSAKTNPEHAAPADARALLNPLVRGVEDFRELVVGHDPRGRIAAGPPELGERPLHAGTLPSENSAAMSSERWLCTAWTAT